MAQFGERDDEIWNSGKQGMESGAYFLSRLFDDCIMGFQRISRCICLNRLSNFRPFRTLFFNLATELLLVFPKRGKIPLAECRRNKTLSEIWK